jgi:hypothetical protein
MAVGVSFQIPAIALRSTVGRLLPAEDHSYAMTDLYVDVDHQITKGIVAAQVVVVIALLLMMVNTLEHRNQVCLLRNVEATRRVVVSVTENAPPMPNGDVRGSRSRIDAPSTLSQMCNE